MKPVQRCVYNFVQYQLYRYVLSNTKTIEEVIKKLVHFSLSILRFQSIFWFKSKQQRKWNKMKCSKKTKRNAINFRILKIWQILKPFTLRKICWELYKTSLEKYFRIQNCCENIVYFSVLCCSIFSAYLTT